MIGNVLRQRSVLWSTKLKGIEDLKDSFALEMEMQVEVFPAGIFFFGLDLIQYFFTMLPFLPFGIVIYSLYHYKLEVCYLLFAFGFIWDYN